jgi:hypothetical protein
LFRCRAAQPKPGDSLRSLRLFLSKTMLNSIPTRLRTATGSHPADASLCFESAPHSSRQPSNCPVRLAAAGRTRSAMANCASSRARLAVSALPRRHPIPIRPPR